MQLVNSRAVPAAVCRAADMRRMSGWIPSPTAYGNLRRSMKCRATEKKEDELTINTEEITQKVTTTLKEAQGKWDEVEEKPAAIAITISAFIAVWALNGVVNAIDNLPLIGSVFELIGIFVAVWFVYRYLIFGPDREELRGEVDKFFGKVTGK